MRKISIGTLDYDNEELGAVIDVIRSGKLSAGDVIEQFECEMAQKHGKKYGIFVNSGQSALDVALILAKVQLEKSKLKVLFPVTTYASDLWSIINTGNEPVFCDIDWNFVINYPTLVNDVYENIQEFDICLPVDLCGYPSRKLSNFYTIEDACEAVGNSFCNYGDIESKYPVSEYCNKNGVIIGCHQHLMREDLDHIATVFNNYKELE